MEQLAFIGMAQCVAASASHIGSSGATVMGDFSVMVMPYGYQLHWAELTGGLMEQKFLPDGTVLGQAKRRDDPSTQQVEAMRRQVLADLPEHLQAAAVEAWKRHDALKTQN